MPRRLLLLTGDIEAPHLTDFLTAHNPTLSVIWTPTSDALQKAVDEMTDDTRLVSMLSDVIVPAEILTALPGPSYNFHPGPPAYPGSHAAGFAIYEGATDFGVTLHEMAPKVDSGAIVEVRRFPIATDAKFMDVEIFAFETLIAMFRDRARHLACDDAPLPLGAERWTGRTHTKAEAAQLSQVEANLSEDEIVRRYRAFG